MLATLQRRHCCGLLQSLVRFNRQQQPELAVIAQPRAGQLQQALQGQAVIVPSQIAGLVISAPTGAEKRRIADDAVIAVADGRGKLLDRAGMQVQPLRPRAGGEIARRVLTGAGIEFHRVNLRLAALRQHQTEQAGASTDIQNAAGARHRHQRAEQTGMGGHPHAAVRLLDPELFELEPVVVFALPHRALRPPAF